MQNNNQYGPAGVAGLLLVLALAFLDIFIFFEKDFLLGTASFWEQSNFDVTQYIVGFNKYMEAPWHHPILHFNSINYPEGTSVTFMDAIPLYALLLKIIIPKSFLPFNPYGIWVALCFVLQGVGAWWIAKELGLKNWVFLFALSVLFLLFPAWLWRIGHISLMSHWILLFALALYIRSYRSQHLQIMAWSILLVCTFYINIYLLAMASGVYLASLFSVGVRHHPRHLLCFFAPYLIIFLSAFITLLPLPPTAATSELGFGYHSMNLLAPFMGGNIFRLQALDTLGQRYEGFNYLGLGVMMLFVLALWYQRRTEPLLFKRHWVLTVLLIVYSLYALSNYVYFGERLIVILKYPSFLDGITSQLRVSGRFFWLVSYSIIIFSLYVLYRHLKPKTFFIVVLAMLILQVFDLQKSIKLLRSMRHLDVTPVINYEKWDQRLQANSDLSTLYYYPKFRCGSGDLGETLLPAMKYATQRHYNINTGYIARYTPRCDDISEEIAASNLQQSAYIFISKEFDGLDEVMSFFPSDSSIGCEEVDFVFICQNKVQVE